MKKIITYTTLLSTTLLVATLPIQSRADERSQAHTHHTENEDYNIGTENSGEFIEEAEKEPETATERRKRKRKEVKERLRKAREYRRGNAPKHYHHH